MTADCVQLEPGAALDPRAVQTAKMVLGVWLDRSLARTVLLEPLFYAEMRGASSALLARTAWRRPRPAPRAPQAHGVLLARLAALFARRDFGVPWDQVVARLVLWDTSAICSPLFARRAQKGRLLASRTKPASYVLLAEGAMKPPKSAMCVLLVHPLQIRASLAVRVAQGHTAVMAQQSVSLAQRAHLSLTQASTACFARRELSRRPCQPAAMSVQVEHSALSGLTHAERAHR